MTENATEPAQSNRSHESATQIDYERAALIAMSKSQECRADLGYEVAALYAAEAQVWATLHLARIAA